MTSAGGRWTAEALFSYVRESKFPPLSTHSVADATTQLPELIDRALQGRALQGEDVMITRGGRSVIALRPVEPPARPISLADIDWQATHRAPLERLSEEDAGTLASRMRDEDWP